ncbi:hypothetical protein BS17DRAFT_190161 [Gyrodon lividus]|nr:hypothetical protein BS17DRAFT_190161 [Gyrodon lividus]
MPGLTLTPPMQIPPHTPPPKKTTASTDVKTIHALAPSKSCCEVDLVMSLPRNATPASESDSDSSSEYYSPPDGESEEAHTLSAYGDLSISENFVASPSEPLSESGNVSPLHPKSLPRPRLRLKVRRPPMPKRRLSYIHIGGPLPYSGDNDTAGQWPGSPSPIENGSPWHRHQPLVSPLPLDSPRVQRDKPASKPGSSLEKLIEGLMPRSASIRLSQPNSPATGAVGLPQDTNEQIRSGGERRNSREAAGQEAPLMQYLQPTPASAVAVEQTKPALSQDKPKSGGGGWRTRLPPRLPIPKWDL